MSLLHRLFASEIVDEFKQETVTPHGIHVFRHGRTHKLINIDSDGSLFKFIASDGIYVNENRPLHTILIEVLQP